MASENEDTESNSSLTINCILSQIIASSALCFMALNMGISLTFSSIVIPDLLGAKGNFSLNGEQASWFGSIGMFVQPIGGILSGAIVEPLGRKNTLMIANLPHVAAWIIMFLVQDISWLFIGMIIIGVGVGLMEAPLMIYVGEMSHPKLRAIMVGYGQIFSMVGFFLTYALAKVFSWRYTALISLSITLLTLILILFIIPETPIWLLSKGRMENAMESLCWIRGWTEPSLVQQEFDNMVKYQKNNSKCQLCSSRDQELEDCIHNKKGTLESLKELFNNMKRKEMLRPLFIVIFLFWILLFTGVMPIKPNIINIYKSFGLSIDPLTATNVTSGLGVLSLIFFMCIIKYSGKRPLLLISLLVIAISDLFLGIYAYCTMPPGFSTYLVQTIIHNPNTAWIPTTLFILLHMMFSLGIGNIPWLLVSEIFPLKGRGHAAGLAAAFAYIFFALAIKTHLNMEQSMGVHGTFWLYSMFTFIGLVFSYLYVPETEGIKIEEIERHFFGKRMKVVANDIITKRLLKEFCYEDDNISKQSEGKDNDFVNVELDVNVIQHIPDRN